MAERERRLGLNEAVFRQVNEQISQLVERFQQTPQELDLVCECGDPSCTKRISMPMSDYEQVRADPLQFAIVPGHDDRAVEVVIARERTYNLVRKRGEAAALAAQSDPRDE
jgi:hypothetical protein